MCVSVDANITKAQQQTSKESRKSRAEAQDQGPNDRPPPRQTPLNEKRSALPNLARMMVEMESRRNEMSTFEVNDESGEGN